MSLLPPFAGGGGMMSEQTLPPTEAAQPPATRPATINRALLHTDGGSRGNPGASGIGFTIDVDDGRGLVTLCRGGAYIGVATNNVAEYRALIWGLRNAHKLGIGRIDVRADSELLVKQLHGAYRVKNVGIKPLFAEAKQLLESFDSYTIEHVMREHNSAADELANEAMDARGMVGDYVVGYESGDLFSASAPAASAPATAAPAASAPAAVAATTGTTQSSSTTSTGSTDTLTPSNFAQRGKNKKGSGMTGKATIGRSTTGIYTLTIKEHFDAAHALIGYPGQCKNLHGHTWDIEVSVRGTELDEVGIVYDFKDLKDNLMGILDQYDHKYLNEVPPFDGINATAENLARVIYGQMAELLPEHMELVEVSVWESPIAKLTYSK
jgi:6-pyruvoyltetrahydropterin/6-carboxytetrahydropterin synthase